MTEAQPATTKETELLALGRHICRLREAVGLTQEELAHAAELHGTCIGRVERGKRNLTYKNILKLARGLGVKPGELFPS